jgi:orotate phosphoribosyltransferase
LEVIRVVVLVDRQEGGLDSIREHVPDTRAIVTRDELMRRWREIRSGVMEDGVTE